MSAPKHSLAEHLTDPCNRGPLSEAQVTGLSHGHGRGGQVRLYLRVDAGTIRAAQFDSFGCGFTAGCASILTEMIVGRTVDACRQLTVSHFVDTIEGLPRHKQHCAMLAVAALHDALGDT
mgnify:CR=1 FL=1